MGRLLLELFIVATGTGTVGVRLSTEDGSLFPYLRDSPRRHLSIFGEIVIIGVCGNPPLD